MIKITPSPKSVNGVIDVLSSMVGPVSASPDSLGCIASVERGKDGRLLYIEQWRTKEALARHLRSNLFDRVLEALEYSSQPPEVDFFEVASVSGLELVALARAGE
ncbi:MAG: antibiotic biosynthesis monooxygenase [Deltaproteobacteria bacterium]|nr:antibiotic biosynthesis monooxygenase [Deltaproteobacteria bacterium]